MELYTTGVKVPKLGSRLDRLSREFLYRKADKDLSLASLIAHIASAAGNNTLGNNQWHNNINRIWQEYVGQSFYNESNRKRQEEDTFKSWEFWKKVRPTIVRSTGPRGKPVMHINISDELKGVKEDW